MAGYRKLGRPTDQRKAMLRNLTTSLLEYGKIETTVTRAKEVKRIADKMVTLGKRGDLHARRQALAFITKEEVVTRLFEEIAPKYEDRQGGYTRIYRVGPRRGVDRKGSLEQLTGRDPERVGRQGRSHVAVHRPRRGGRGQHDRRL